MTTIFTPHFPLSSITYNPSPSGAPASTSYREVRGGRNPINSMFFSNKSRPFNRLNAQKSTGPRSPEGKAAVRFNALKSGIDAQSQVIPGEDPAALALLAAEYHDHYQPATPEVRALVDALVAAEWLQRRFRSLEAQLWELQHPRTFTSQAEGLESRPGLRPGNSEVFNRLQRRIDAAELHLPTHPPGPYKLPKPRAPQLGFPLRPRVPKNGPRPPRLALFLQFHSNHPPAPSAKPASRQQHHVRPPHRELLRRRFDHAHLARVLARLQLRQRSLGVFHFADEIDAWQPYFGVNAKKSAGMDAVSRRGVRRLRNVPKACGPETPWGA